MVPLYFPGMWCGQRCSNPLMFFYSHYISLSLCPSFCPPHSDSTFLPLYLQSNPFPLPRLPSNPLSFVQRRRAGLFNPTSVGQSPSYLSSCGPSAGENSDGGWDLSISLPLGSVSPFPSQQRAWCCPVQTEEEWMSLSTIFLWLPVSPWQKRHHPSAAFQ